MKICAVCGNGPLPYHRRYCSNLCAKKARKEYDARNYQQNKDYFKAKARRWECENRWQALARVTRWKKDNPEKLRRCVEAERQRLTAALNVYREMGLAASSTDRQAIYKVLKAELPNLNI